LPTVLIRESPTKEHCSKNRKQFPYCRLIRTTKLRKVLGQIRTS
jgi:hypothetical protein